MPTLLRRHHGHPVPQPPGVATPIPTAGALTTTTHPPPKATYQQGHKMLRNIVISHNFRKVEYAATYFTAGMTTAALLGYFIYHVPTTDIVLTMGMAILFVQSALATMRYLLHGEPTGRVTPPVWELFLIVVAGSAITITWLPNSQPVNLAIFTVITLALCATLIAVVRQHTPGKMGPHPDDKKTQ